MLKKSYLLAGLSLALGAGIYAQTTGVAHAETAIETVKVVSETVNDRVNQSLGGEKPDIVQAIHDSFRELNAFGAEAFAMTRADQETFRELFQQSERLTESSSWSEIHNVIETFESYLAQLNVAILGEELTQKTDVLFAVLNQKTKEEKARVIERSAHGNWCWVVASQYLLRHEVVMKDLRRGQVPSQEEIFGAVFSDVGEDWYYHNFDNEVVSMPEKAIMGNQEDVANALSCCLGNRTQSAVYEVAKRGEARLTAFLRRQLLRGPIAYKCYDKSHWITITEVRGTRVSYCDSDGRAKESSLTALFGNMSAAGSYQFVSVSAVLNGGNDYRISRVANAPRYAYYSVY